MIINTKKAGGITPSGSLPISENGTYDVTQYAEAVVNVSGGGAPNYFDGTFIQVSTSQDSLKIPYGGDIPHYTKFLIIIWRNSVPQNQNDVVMYIGTNVTVGVANAVITSVNKLCNNPAASPITYFDNMRGNVYENNAIAPNAYYIRTGFSAYHFTTGEEYRYRIYNLEDLGVE